MEKRTYTRLRQVCLATDNIRHSEAVLSRVLGLTPCHKSKLSAHGIENSLFAIGHSFIELVSPVDKNTPVERFLVKSGGLGGYMAIFDCEDTGLRKELLKLHDIGIIQEYSSENVDQIQLDPRKTNITMLELDHHKEGRRRMDAYEWAGPNWQRHVYRAVVEDISKFVFRCHDPEKKAKEWGRFLITMKKQLPAENPSLTLDYGTLEFVSCPPAAKEYFSEIHILCHDRPGVIERAREEDLNATDDRFSFCGVDIVLVDSE